jgi:hypothetical protein
MLCRATTVPGSPIAPALISDTFAPANLALSADLAGIHFTVNPRACSAFDRRMAAAATIGYDASARWGATG